MSTTVKIILIIVIVIALGIGVFVYRLGTTGGFKLSSSSFGNLSGFSFLPQQKGPTLQNLPQGSGGSSTGGGTTIGTPGYSQPTTSLTIDPSTLSAGEIPAGFTAKQLSPYFHEVRYQNVTVGTSYSYGTISLMAGFRNSNATGTIDITGWQIKSKNSGEYIPQAIVVYDPSGLAAPSDIRMANGDTTNLYSSSAPFNLRLNKCIGYIAHVANFQPGLPINCPYVNLSQIANFTGACQNYIQTLGGCQAPNMTSPQIPRNDYACQSYLQNNFTYKSCVQSHAGDPDFLSNQVWVWMGSNVIDQYHDIVGLYDRSGLLVDQYSY